MTTPTNPSAALGQMINAYWATFSIHAAAKLGIADLLAGGPMPVGALADRTGTKPDPLYRLLRALASLGIFRETDGPGHVFEQTPLSEPLRGGVPGSVRGLAVMTGMLHLRAWPEILHSLATGETALKKVFGQELFEHVGANPELARVFDEAFGGYTAMISGIVAGKYDFARFQRIIDVGGGNGALLTAVLATAPGARGVTFDLPHVTARAKETLARSGVADRCEAVAGDFFAAVPADGDAYVLKMILHDWDDAKAVAILKNVRRAMWPGSALLVVESVVPPGNEPSPSKLLDVNMLVMTGGRERTRDEYATLMEAAGFTLERVVPCGPTDVVEGRAVA
jgi:predicted O-methyltransferase YrrM